MAVALYGSSGFCHYFFLISKDTFSFLPQASAERLPLWHSSYEHLLLSAHVFLVSLSSHFHRNLPRVKAFFQGILNYVSFSTFSGAIYICISKIFFIELITEIFYCVTKVSIFNIKFLSMFKRREVKETTRSVSSPLLSSSSLPFSETGLYHVTLGRSLLPGSGNPPTSVSTAETTGLPCTRSFQSLLQLLLP